VVLSARRLPDMLPEAVRRDLARFLEHAETILSVLEDTKGETPSASSAVFARMFAQRLSMSVGDARRVLHSLQNLLSLDQEAGDPETIVEIIARRMPSDVQEQWAAKKPVLKSILTLAAADHPAVISIKAARLAHEHERIFLSAEILTDVRPVYTTKGDQILEMIIQHKLVLTQHGSDHENTNIHFAMDAADVINLKKACDRAIQKAQVLKDSLGTLPWVTEVLGEDE